MKRHVHTNLEATLSCGAHNKQKPGSPRSQTWNTWYWHYTPQLALSLCPTSLKILRSGYPNKTALLQFFLNNLFTIFTIYSPKLIKNWFYCWARVTWSSRSQIPNCLWKGPMIPIFNFSPLGTQTLDPVSWYLCTDDLCKSLKNQNLSQSHSVSNPELATELLDVE